MAARRWVASGPVASAGLSFALTPPSAPSAAPPLVILHGLLGASRNFNSWVKGLGLAAPRAVYAVNLINHGDSPHRSGVPMAYSSMAADVLELLDREELEHAVLLGHSMGGKVAMRAALDAPGRVRGLGVLDIAPASYASSEPGSQWQGNLTLLRAMAALELQALPTRRDADAELARAVEDPYVRAFALSNLAGGRGKLRWKCNLGAIIESLPLLAGWKGGEADEAYEGPTAFVRGGASPYIQRDTHSAEMTRLFPQHTLHTIEDCGHWVHAEKPAETQLLVREFLDRV